MACETCVKTMCCTEYTACYMDPDCECLADCLVEGQTPGACGTQCGVAQPLTQASFMPVVACAQGPCMASCL
jgi:hypothetical protein